jgi:hypothetical protein
MKTLMAIYRSMGDARAALEALVESGIERERISLTAAGRQPYDVVGDDVDLERRARTSEGAAIGGAGGAIAGILAFGIPGIGPAIGLGPLALAVAGTATGAVGSLVGALVGRGVPNREARLYEAAVKRGDVLIVVEADDEQTPIVDAVLEQFHRRSPDAGAPIVAHEGALGRAKVSAVPVYHQAPAAEDRYDEGSGPDTPAIEPGAFGSSLGIDSPPRGEGTRGGSIDASSDLSLRETSGSTSAEALDPGSDVRNLPVGDEELVPPRLRAQEPRVPKSGRPEEVNLEDEVLHGEALPEREGEHADEAEGVRPRQSEAVRPEGAEPDEDRLPSPTTR